MKIFCVGRNYVAHAKELNNEVPDEPIIFMKPKSALLQAHTPFYYPEFTNELHYECELVLRISKNGKSLLDIFSVFGYTKQQLAFIIKLIGKLRIIKRSMGLQQSTLRLHKYNGLIRNFII